MRNPDDGRHEPQEHAGDDQPAQRLGLRRGKPLPRVTPHVRVPQIDEAMERHVFQAGAAEMLSASRGDDIDRLSRLGQTAAVVDVLEPGGRKLLVERSDLIEDFAPKEERRRRGLIDALWSVEMKIAIAVARGSPVSRKPFLEGQNLRG